MRPWQSSGRTHARPGRARARKPPKRSWFELRDKVGATEFLGYETEIAEGKVVALLVDGEPVERIKPGEDAAIITNQTPFYGESGGQTGDTGIIFSADGAEFPVIDTVKKLGDMHVHLGKLSRGELALGDIVEMKVDKILRDATRANHSANASVARGIAPGARRSRHAEGLDGRAGASPLRLQPSQAHDRG